MGCVSAHPAVAEKKSFGQKRGYSVRHFVDDYLVPVDCFACNVPADVGAMEDLAWELHAFHTTRAEIFEQETVMGRLAHKKPVAPEKAFCMVRLNDVDIDGNFGDGTFDLADNDFQLQLRLSGAVLVPRTAEWLHSPSVGGAKALLPAPPGKGEEAPMRLIVQVWCLMKAKAVQLSDGEIARGISISPKRVVFKSCGRDSDPMVESWLPIPDFLHCLKLVLNMKVQESFDDPTSHASFVMQMESHRTSEH